jgi:hypothetical protein
VQLHFGAFKNSGVIQNSVPRILAPARIQFEAAHVATIDAALYDLATLPPDQLRSRRYGGDDLATLLARRFKGLPGGEEFWGSLADEDVLLAAARARSILGYLANRAAGGPLPPDPQR